MKRAIQQWRNCDPGAMVAHQSQAALTYALEDAKADILQLHGALERAERKLTAYVGVCSGDKELTDTVLPMARTALAKAVH